MPPEFRSRRPSRSPASDDPKADPLDPVVIKLLTKAASRLSRQPGFSPADQPDLRQVLLERLLARRRAFDPRRGSWRAFAATVIARQAESLRRDRFALKRDPRRTSAAWTDWDEDRRLPKPNPGPADQDLRMDVAAVVVGLPPKLRELADRLGHEPLAAAARSLAIPRRTARDRLRRIRLRFERAGLEIYL
jgi:RNA polymerase sigma factor (sigma-70 family)